MKAFINFSIAVNCLGLLWVGIIDSQGSMMSYAFESLKKIEIDLIVESIEKVENLDVVHHLIQGSRIVKN